MRQKMKGNAFSALILVLTFISVESYPTYSFNVRCYGIGKETLCIPDGLKVFFIPTPKIDDDIQMPRNSKRIPNMMAIDTTHNDIEARSGRYFLLQVCATTRQKRLQNNWLPKFTKNKAHSNSQVYHNKAIPAIFSKKLSCLHPELF